MNNEITIKLPLERYNELIKREKVLKRYQDNAIVKCIVWLDHDDYYFYKKESEGLKSTGLIILRLESKIKAILNRPLWDRIVNDWNQEGEENISLS